MSAQVNKVDRTITFQNFCILFSMVSVRINSLFYYSLVRKSADESILLVVKDPWWVERCIGRESIGRLLRSVGRGRKFSIIDEVEETMRPTMVSGAMALLSRQNGPETPDRRSPWRQGCPSRICADLPERRGRRPGASSASVRDGLRRHGRRSCGSGMFGFPDGTPPRQRADGRPHPRGTSSESGGRCRVLTTMIPRLERPGSWSPWNPSFCTSS